MRWIAALLVIVAPRVADADDPRDLFGLGKGANDEKPASCDEPHTFGCATTTDPLDDESPYALRTWLPGSYLRDLPVGYATHDTIAHWGLGASRDEAGVVLGGATGLENRWTLDGAPIDNVRTGAADTRLPLTFLAGLTVQAGGFAARDRTSTGGVIDAQLRKGGEEHELDVQVWAGVTGASRARPIANGTYFVRRLELDAAPNVAASLVGTGPLGEVLGGKAWYAAGIAPELAGNDATWRATRLIDADGDGVPEGFPGQLETQPIGTTEARAREWFVPIMARLGLDTDVHHVELTLVGHASHSTRFLANATQQAAGIDRDELVVDGIASWRGTWKHTRARVQLAWHRNDRRESAHDDDAEDLPQLLSAYVPMTLAEDPGLAALCHDGTYPSIAQCAVPLGYFASGGAGLMQDSVGDRPTATAEITHERGHHVVRAGATLEDARLIVASRLSGGEQHRSLFDGHLDRTRFVDGACEELPGAPCSYTSESRLRYRTRYAAAYLEDTFSPREDLRVDGGVRWELMWVGEQVKFSDQLAPRLGVAWDVLGEGRSRVWTSMGRSFALLPTGLGPTVVRRDASARDVTTPLGEVREVDTGGAYRVADGIAPMAQDELTLGVELGLERAVRLTAWVQGRWLRRGLESTPMGFDNPGRDGVGPARRASEQLAVELATSPTNKLVLRAGYLAGRTLGNFLGAYDPRTGAVLYNGEDFNAGVASSTDYGRLPTDVGHRVFVEADRSGSIGGVELAFAMRLALSSGRPRSLMATTDVGPVQLLERGSMGRGELIATTNARLGATWREFELALEVFNVFDRDTATRVDDVYSSDFVRAIEGGGYDDVPFVKTIDGANPTRRSGFGLPVTFQAPISAVLGLHRSF